MALRGTLPTTPPSLLLVSPLPSPAATCSPYCALLHSCLPASCAAELKELADEVSQCAWQRRCVPQHDVEGEGEGVHVLAKHRLASHKAHSLQAGRQQQEAWLSFQVVSLPPLGMC